MKKLFKNKQGFTLIELLVVIGILAVLAAIAIPSVAGLIDRSNKSADNTNANEMTNAVERFVSEYELYCQDVMSGTIDFNNLDSAQSRIHNVTGIEKREDITAIEGEDGFGNVKINKDTKYPQNTETAKSVMQNYTKTSSSTFQTKQSDMTYWYNKATGETIVAEKDASIDDLLRKLNLPDISEDGIDILTGWIDLETPYEAYSPTISAKNEVSTDPDFKYKFSYVIKIPNKDKYLIDYDNFMWIGGNKNKPLYIDSRQFSSHISFCINHPNSNAVVTEDVITFEAPFGYNDYLRNEKWSFRLVYKFEDNGVTKYLYSPITVVIPANLD